MATPIDVIVYMLEPKDQNQTSTHFKDLSDLEKRLCPDTDSDHPELPDHVVLLINDVFDELSRFLHSKLGFHPTASSRHTSGRVNDKASLSSKLHLHTDSLEATLFDRLRPNQSHTSITWWRLFRHSRAGYSREREAFDEDHADTNKVVAPHFVLNISDTRIETRPNDLRRQLESRKPDVKQWYGNIKTNILGDRKQALVGQRDQEGSPDQIPLPVQESTPALTPTSEQDEDRGDGQYKATINLHKLSCRTYRPHQVVTEVHDDNWGCAGEERVTFSQGQVNGTTFYFLLFDEPRKLQTLIRSVKLEQRVNAIFQKLWEDSDISALPAVTVVSEQAGPIIPTFSKHDDENNDPFMTSAISTAGVDLVADPTRYSSTREMFISHAHIRGLLGHQSTRNPDSEDIKSKIKISVANLIAEDWNLVLSQMGNTLDQIDSKMSDNMMLRENVLPWRR
ncbi:hypothetical protein MMC25_000900 [Agyrium rufum]|nr:hypothetical protein [Agyrium rufum]